MTPWRKRLGDYAQQIRQADQTYFEPELFRMNAQSAIQTARTVTWLIHKNKESIPDFDSWYKSNVEAVLAADPVMKWLKDSRNFIEKQGDLAMFSECSVELMYSYTEAGPKLILKREELLPAGMKKIIRFARKHFPTGVVKDSALVVERRWVANTLPRFELTDALQHGYDVLRRIVDAVDVQCGRGHPRTESLDRIPIGSLQRRAYTKISTGETHVLTRRVREVNTGPRTVQELESRYGAEVVSTLVKKSHESFSDAFDRICRSASALFNADGTHVRVGFLLDRNLSPIQINNVEFDDHTDKFIYWSQLAHWISLNNDVFAVIFVGETWLRSLHGFPSRSMSELPIIGEGLHIVGLSKDGQYLSKRFKVVEQDGRKRLDGELTDQSSSIPNFFVPLARVWSLHSLLNSSSAAGANIDGNSDLAT